MELAFLKVRQTVGVKAKMSTKKKIRHGKSIISNCSDGQLCKDEHSGEAPEEIMFELGPE